MTRRIRWALILGAPVAVLAYWAASVVGLVLSERIAWTLSR
jgi:hypothetical protein